MQKVFVINIFLLTIHLASCLDRNLDHHWTLWKNVHEKVYKGDEETFRRTVWEANLEKVQEHNLLAELGVYSFTLGMNKFADLTINEFSKMMTSYNMSGYSRYDSKQTVYTRNANFKLPDTVDWRTLGYVTPVKDQGQCVGGWAFASTGAVEGQHFNATKKLVSLSEQNLIDCSGTQGNMGCVGGEAYQSFEYIRANGGIDTEDGYPYEDDDNQCRFQSGAVGATVTGYVNVKSKDEGALQQAVATIGPIAVSIDSSHTSFQLYKSGIYHEVFCSQVTLDHSLLVVGYGVDSGKDYWLVKNSWGVNWGEQGYVRMTRNKRNECGIATSASYPLV